MLESYIKIKFIEECIGIVITILIMFGAFFLFSVLPLYRQLESQTG